MQMDNNFVVRWDKEDPHDFDIQNINEDALVEFVNHFLSEEGFHADIGIHDNFHKYARFIAKGRYKPERVAQSLMRILNVFRKRYQKDDITTLDELKYAAILSEEALRKLFVIESKTF
jgi:hypothetical protein